MRTSCVIRLMISLTLPLTLTACGEDEKKTDDAAVDQKAEVVKFANGAAEVSFDGAEANQQFALMPISLGDPATVQGASVETTTFTLEAAAGGGTFQLKGAVQAPRAMSAKAREHGMRTLLNRYDSSRVDQPQWFWDLARRVDGTDLSLTESIGPVERIFRKGAKAKLTESLTTAGDCPAVGGDVVVPDVEDPASPDTSASITTGNAISGDDYCIVYLSDPAAGTGTKAEVEATVKEAISRYKSLIYKSDFPAVADYTFKPVIVLMDFGDEDVWPKTLQIGGAFDGSMSKEAKMPMLYMPHDLTRLDIYKNLDAASQKSTWHSTVVHELQHAIINYFRKHATADSDDEVPAIDEGLAHFMEDLFGYGQVDFGGFSKAFLDTWAVNANPAIHATVSDELERGGAQTFLYYLQSQKGGIKFTADGVVSSGGGLDFLVEIVKNAGGKKGPDNLKAKFGEDWLQTVANYFGALTLDNGNLGTDAALEVQAPEKIKDLTGGTDKDFGMRFNGFGGREKSINWSAWEAKVGTTTEVESSFYATAPVLYTVTDPSAKVKFTTIATAANTAVIKVRVK